MDLLNAGLNFEYLPTNYRNEINVKLLCLVCKNNNFTITVILITNFIFKLVNLVKEKYEWKDYNNMSCNVWDNLFQNIRDTFARFPRFYLTLTHSYFLRPFTIARYNVIIDIRYHTVKVKHHRNEIMACLVSITKMNVFV